MPKTAHEMASKSGNRVRSRFAERGSTENLWERLGWNPIDLAEHLERYFYNDMSWENFGTWQIDHTIPLSRGFWIHEFGSNQKEIKKLQRRLDGGNEPPHVRDIIVRWIEDYEIEEKIWSLQNLRPLFKEDHIMKTEFESYIRGGKEEEYVHLCGMLYDYYGKTPVDREKMQKYFHHKWPKKWIQEISKEVELYTKPLMKSGSNWYDLLDKSKSTKLCNGITQMGFSCEYKAMKGDDMCYLHTTKEMEDSSAEDLEVLKNMLVHVPSAGTNLFARKLEGSKSRYPSETSWKRWINEFPLDHPIYTMYERKHYNLEKTDIAMMLIRYCSPGMDSINTLLKENGYDLKRIRTKWQRFWKAHKIVLEEFEKEQSDG